MAEEQLDQKTGGGKHSPPYVSYKTLRNVLDGFAATMPSRIDRSVLHTLSGAVQAQVGHALKALQLVSSNGLPTNELRLLVAASGEDRKQKLATTLRLCYPFAFDHRLDLESATAKQLTEVFNEQTSHKGDTIRKAIAFFLAACQDAGLKTSPFFKNFRAKSANGSARPRREQILDPVITSESPLSPKAEPANAPNTGPASGVAPGSTWAEMLLAKFPVFDPSWPDELKTKWFEGFEKLMKSQP